MTNHPNRSKAGSAARNPAAEEITAARESAGLGKTEAADMVHTTYRTWQQWEEGDRRMHPAFWELFQIKARVNQR